MCSIAGVVSRGDGAASVDPEFIVRAMAAARRHRGPDGQGVWVHGGGAEGMGLERAHPTVVFDGEIQDCVELHVLAISTQLLCRELLGART